MRISTKGRYALRVMIDLASFGNDNFIALKDISQRQNIPIKYLEQIVSTLNKAGYLNSMRGSNGGYRLSKPSEEYNVGDVLRTVEGTLNPVECVAVENGVTCPHTDSCNSVTFWKGLDDVVNKYIDSYTLKDLIPQ